MRGNRRLKPTASLLVRYPRERGGWYTTPRSGHVEPLIDNVTLIFDSLSYVFPSFPGI